MSGLEFLCLRSGLILASRERIRARPPCGPRAVERKRAVPEPLLCARNGHSKTCSVLFPTHAPPAAILSQQRN